jgi:hypothetical protein
MVNLTYSEGYTPKDAVYFSIVVAHAEAREKSRLTGIILRYLNDDNKKEYLTYLIQRRGN